MAVTVVEGPTDVTFFNELKRLRDLPLDLQPAGGAGNIPEVVRTLIQIDRYTELVVVQDINAGPPDRVIQSIQSVVSNSLGGSPVENLTPNGDRFTASAVTVSVVPMGLPDDPELRALGMTSHAMEDYLIKVLLLDRTLRPDVPELRQLIEELTATIRRYSLTFNPTKGLFQLIKPVIQLAHQDTAAVSRLFRNADGEIVRSVMEPLLDRLERAVAQ